MIKALSTLIAALVVVLGLIGLFLWKQVSDFPDKKMAGDGELVDFEIARGMPFEKMASLLEEKGLVSSAFFLKAHNKQHEFVSKIKSGEYRLANNLAPKDIIAALVKGAKEEHVRVTLKEGLHMLEIFEEIEKKEIASKEELLKLAVDPEFLGGHGITGQNIDGYLFPETYQFKKATPPKKVLDRLIEEHKKVWARVLANHSEAYEKQKNDLGWNDFQFLTMASIVEKEAVVDEERARIAQVFINRLISDSFVPHRLDTDPTIRYGCMVATPESKGCKNWKWTDRLRRAQLDDDENTYNTYQHEGLPPGPICNPGEKSMAATINSDGSSFFFFVARNDGTHIFSKTRQDHEKAVDKYQR